MSDIDVSLYVRAPQSDVPTAVALGVSLLSALPRDAPPQVKAAARQLRASVVALQAAWRGTPAAAPAVTKRAADSATDNAWGCLEARLSAAARLPVSRHPSADRAQEIHAALFPTGLDFVTLAFKAQWAEGENRLHLIEKAGYAADIDDLAGPEYLAEIRLTHKVYGEVLAITKAEDLPPEVSLLEPLREVGRKVAAHALQLVAWASAHPASEPAVRKALKPIERMLELSA